MSPMHSDISFSLRKCSTFTWYVPSIHITYYSVHKCLYSRHTQITNDKKADTNEVETHSLKWRRHSCFKYALAMVRTNLLEEILLCLNYLSGVHLSNAIYRPWRNILRNIVIDDDEHHPSLLNTSISALKMLRYVNKTDLASSICSA